MTKWQQEKAKGPGIFLLTACPVDPARGGGGGRQLKRVRQPSAVSQALGLLATDISSTSL